RQHYKMAYTWYEEDVVFRHGILLEGWPAATPFQNPSTLSTAIPNLRKITDRLERGKCAFRKLSSAEVMERKKRWEEDVAAGRAVAKHRSQHSDCGVLRKR
ncbi:hypothetical protein DFH08DRAFT_614313, partial [Mycena albidolilacea]